MQALCRMSGFIWGHTYYKIVYMWYLLNVIVAENLSRVLQLQTALIADSRAQSAVSICCHITELKHGFLNVLLSLSRIVKYYYSKKYPIIKYRAWTPQTKTFDTVLIYFQSKNEMSISAAIAVCCVICTSLFSING